MGKLMQISALWGCLGRMGELGRLIGRKPERGEARVSLLVAAWVGSDWVRRRMC